MRPLGKAAIRAGLIDDDALREMQRWRMVPQLEDEDLEPVGSVEEAVQLIQDALEAEEQVRLQSTDLDVLRHYLEPKNQRRGRLVIVNHETDTRGSKNITFCITPSRGYAIPWTSETVEELMTNGFTYLSYKEEGDEKPRRVYFTSVDELYFGDIKAFMVCAAEDAHVEQG